MSNEIDEIINEEDENMQIQFKYDCDECECTKEEIDKFICQNLSDAGCTQEQIKEFFDAKDNKSKLIILRKHRSTLLEKVHAEQKKLSCLDYLIYKIRKQL